MRVISGNYKGKKLFSINNSLLNPTSDYLKETLFNLIQHKYKDFLLCKNFLDIYAGSGSIALEAVSRGASSVTLVEKELLHYKLIKKNFDNIPFNIINKDFLLTDSSLFKKKYSIIYLDPPYNLNLLPKSLNHLIKLNILEKLAVVITESKKKTFSEYVNTHKTILSHKLKLHLKLVKKAGIKELHFFEYINKTTI